VYLGAHVLLPAGFDEHPEARYPIAVFHGHFPYDFGGWRTSPPDPDEPCAYSARFDVECYNRVQDSVAYELHQQWTSEDFPRMLVVEIQHANPYYDDSYAVNSENLGPYGDAITYELIPWLEERFRGIGEIDREVAEHCRENYDLVHILRRDWATLGPRLEGKLNIYVGDMDNYYLNNAVYLAEDFLEGTTDPYYAGEIDYGDRAEHCWNGDQTLPNHLSRLRYVQMHAWKILDRLEESMPQGGDTSWRY
jgi:hypothetical protein